MKFKIAFEQTLEFSPDIIVQFRPTSGDESNSNSWQPALVRSQGSIFKEGRIVDLLLDQQEKTGSFFWNLFLSGIEAEGKYDLLLTPIARIEGEHPVGPPYQVEISIDPPPVLEGGTQVRISPPERIITPGLAGYNDQLEVLFRPVDADSLEPSNWQFSVYSLSSVQLFVADGETSLQSLSNGWYKCSWDGRDQQGFLFPSGLYIYFLRIRDEIKKGTFVIAR